MLSVFFLPCQTIILYFYKSNAREKERTYRWAEGLKQKNRGRAQSGAVTIHNSNLGLNCSIRDTQEYGRVFSHDCFFISTTNATLALFSFELLLRNVYPWLFLRPQELGHKYTLAPRVVCVYTFGFSSAQQPLLRFAVHSLRFATLLTDRQRTLELEETPKKTGFLSFIFSFLSFPFIFFSLAPNCDGGSCERIYLRFLRL